MDESPEVTKEHVQSQNILKTGTATSTDVIFLDEAKCSSSAAVSSDSPHNHISATVIEATAPHLLHSYEYSVPPTNADKQVNMCTSNYTMKLEVDVGVEESVNAGDIDAEADWEDDEPNKFYKAIDEINPNCSYDFVA